MRFLAAVLGGWMVVRGAILIGDAPDPPRIVAGVPTQAPAIAKAPRPADREVTAAGFLPEARAREYAKRAPRYAPESTGHMATPPQPLRIPPMPAAPPPGIPRAPRIPVTPPQEPATSYPDRWSGSAWLLLRGSGAQGLATGGGLGGAQAGARIAFRVGGGAARPLALVARISSALTRPAGAEAAAGIEWQPTDLPVRLLAERRLGIAGGGRSAFALLAYGGVYERRIGPARIDAYAQAGIVGLSSRDPFVDGAIRAGVPLDDADRFRVGAGAWSAAQPGAERIDIGPQLSFRLPGAGTNLRLLADWRFRIAGDAAPGSGPALTLASDF